MKKLLALVLAVAMLASISGVAMAANYQETGNGALSGPHYNLNIIGMKNEKDSPMTGTSGHTIFVPLKGRAKIELFNSDTEESCTKDFMVLDRNAFDDPAQFCLPFPVIDEENDTVSYTVFARALGKPGGTSFTTTCATDPKTDELWCSSITMKLERSKGKSTFMDVSKYLLVLYIDMDGDGNLERYGLFDPALEDYFWRYDNNGLKLVQLRFYMTPTDIPAPGDVAAMSIDPACGIPGSPVDVAVTGNANTDFTLVRDIFIVDEDGLEATGISASDGDNAANSFTLSLVISGDTPHGDYTIYITDKNKETMSTTFTVAGSCD